MAYEQHRAAEKYVAHRTEYCSSSMVTAKQIEACNEEGKNANTYLPWGYVLFSWPEGVTAWAIIATGFVVAWQAVETRKSAIATESAATASLKQAEFMVASERPFLLVTTRGTNSAQFVVRNCGRSPAQILFMDPILKPEYPKWVEERQEFGLPYPPKYGLNYDDDRWEQINVQWIAPGDEMHFASVDPRIFDSLPQQTREEINHHQRAIRIYSSIKYRGMFSPEVYHSRFCYGWSPSGMTYITGPYGYNQYT